MATSKRRQPRNAQGHRGEARTTTERIATERTTTGRTATERTTTGRTATERTTTERTTGRRSTPRAADTTAAHNAQQSEAVGTEVELDITNIAHGGVCVARHDGRVVFVSDAIPGERVRARITEARHDRFWRADTVEVREASPHRQRHVWQAASVDRPPRERAGGAEFGHIALAHQRELKASVITDALSRMGGVERSIVVEPAAGDDESNGLGWRTRVRLHVADDGTVGPYAARSHHVVPVGDLPLATPAVAAAAPLNERFTDATAIEIVAPSTGGEIVLVDDGKRSSGPGQWHPIVEKVGTRSFRLDARGFWQVHARAAETLTAAVQDAVAETSFDPAAANLDLYGGVGLLAAAIGDAFGPNTRITSVESSPAATDAAAENLADWVGAAAITARVERFLGPLVAQASARERSRQRAATVVLDPPRSGAGASVVRALAALEPAQVVYVACDPVAFARDVALFADAGYQLQTLRAFDLFPHTHHVEVVARLGRS